ncbi:MAG: VOC family protein, partial [Planctomycetota bacterium]
EIEGFEPSPFEAEFGRHVALFHPGDDFRGLRDRLAEQNVPIIDPIRPTPFERIFFRDPNGYMIEVINEDEYIIE